MAHLLIERLAGALRRRVEARLRRRPKWPPQPRHRKLAAPRPQISQPKPRTTTMNLSFLVGYRTYVIAVAMLLAGLAQLLGVDIPSFDGQSAGHLLMEGLAILFLRKGMKVTAG